MFDFGFFPALDDLAAKQAVRHPLFGHEKAAFILYKLLIYWGIIAPVALLAFGRQLILSPSYWIVVLFLLLLIAVGIGIWAALQAENVLIRVKAENQD